MRVEHPRNQRVRYPPRDMRKKSPRNSNSKGSVVPLRGNVGSIATMFCGSLSRIEQKWRPYLTHIFENLTRDLTLVRCIVRNGVIRNYRRSASVCCRFQLILPVYTNFSCSL